MGILDEVEKMDDRSMEARLADIEKNQEKILEMLERVTEEIRAMRAERAAPGRDRMSR